MDRGLFLQHFESALLQQIASKTKTNGANWAVFSNDLFSELVLNIPHIFTSQEISGVVQFLLDLHQRLFQRLQEKDDNSCSRTRWGMIVILRVINRCLDQNPKPRHKHRVLNLLFPNQNKHDSVSLTLPIQPESRSRVQSPKENEDSGTQTQLNDSVPPKLLTLAFLILDPQSVFSASIDPPAQLFHTEASHIISFISRQYFASTLEFIKQVLEKPPFRAANAFAHLSISLNQLGAVCTMACHAIENLPEKDKLSVCDGVSQLLWVYSSVEVRDLVHMYDHRLSSKRLKLNTSLIHALHTWAFSDDCTRAQAKHLWPLLTILHAFFADGIMRCLEGSREETPQFVFLRNLRNAAKKSTDKKEIALSCCCDLLRFASMLLQHVSETRARPIVLAMESFQNQLQLQFIGVDLYGDTSAANQKNAMIYKKSTSATEKEMIHSYLVSALALRPRHSINQLISIMLEKDDKELRVGFVRVLLSVCLGTHSFTPTTIDAALDTANQPLHSTMGSPLTKVRECLCDPLSHLFCSLIDKGKLTNADKKRTSTQTLMTLGVVMMCDPLLFLATASHAPPTSLLSHIIQCFLSTSVGELRSAMYHTLVRITIPQCAAQWAQASPDVFIDALATIIVLLCDGMIDERIELWRRVEATRLLHSVLTNAVATLERIPRSLSPQTTSTHNSAMHKLESTLLILLCHHSADYFPLIRDCMGKAADIMFAYKDSVDFTDGFTVNNDIYTDFGNPIVIGSSGPGKLQMMQELLDGMETATVGATEAFAYIHGLWTAQSALLTKTDDKVDSMGTRTSITFTISTNTSSVTTATNSNTNPNTNTRTETIDRDVAQVKAEWQQCSLFVCALSHILIKSEVEQNAPVEKQTGRRQTKTGGLCTVAQFVNQLADLMVSENLFVRETIIGTVSSGLSPALHANLVKRLISGLEAKSKEDTRDKDNSRLYMVVERTAMLARQLLQTFKAQQDHADALTTADYGGLSLLVTDQADSMGNDVAAVRLKVKVCKLLKIVMEHSDCINFVDRTRFSQHVLAKTSDWVASSNLHQAPKAYSSQPSRTHTSLPPPPGAGASNAGPQPSPVSFRRVSLSPEPVLAAASISPNVQTGPQQTQGLVGAQQISALQNSSATTSSPNLTPTTPPSAPVRDQQCPPPSPNTNSQQPGICTSQSLPNVAENKELRVVCDELETHGTHVVVLALSLLAEDRADTFQQVSPNDISRRPSNTATAFLYKYSTLLSNQLIRALNGGTSSDLTPLTIRAFGHLLFGSSAISRSEILRMVFHTDASLRAVYLAVFSAAVAMLPDAVAGPSANTDVINLPGGSASNDTDVKMTPQQRIWHLLFQEDKEFMLVCTLLEACSRQAVDAMLELVLSLASVRHQELSLIEQVVIREIDECLSPQTLFRVNSIATKLMTGFARASSGSLLANVLGPCISHVCSLDVALDVTNHPENIQLLATATKKFLDSIIGSLSMMPVAIRNVCHILQNSVSHKFPQSKTVVLVGFIFLRFFSPAIATPEKFGAVPSGVTPNTLAHTNFIAIAKLMQAISNHTSAKESGDVTVATAYREIEPFFLEQVSRMGQFIKDLPLEKAQQSTQADETIDVQISDMPVDIELNGLHCFVVANMLALEEKIAPKTLGNDERCQIWVLLQNILSEVEPPMLVRQPFGSRGTMRVHTMRSKQGFLTEAFLRDFNVAASANQANLAQFESVFYRRGVSLRGNPVYYYIARFVQKDAQWDILLHHILSSLHSLETDVEFEVVIDCTSWGILQDPPPSLARKLRSYVPAEKLDLVSAVYIVNMSSHFKRTHYPTLLAHTKRKAKLMASNKKRDFRIVVCTSDQLSSHISDAGIALPLSTLSLFDSVTFKQGVSFGNEPWAISVGSDSLLFSRGDLSSGSGVGVGGNASTSASASSSKAICVVDVLPLSCVVDVRLDRRGEGVDECVVQIANVPICLRFNCADSSELLHHTHMARERFRHSTPRSDNGNNPDTCSIHDLRGMLLSAGLINLSAENAATSRAAYDLLSLVCKKFDFPDAAPLFRRTHGENEKPDGVQANHWNHDAQKNSSFLATSVPVFVEHVTQSVLRSPPHVCSELWTSLVQALQFLENANMLNALGDGVSVAIASWTSYLAQQSTSPEISEQVLSDCVAHCGLQPLLLSLLRPTLWQRVGKHANLVRHACGNALNPDTLQVLSPRAVATILSCFPQNLEFVTGAAIVEHLGKMLADLVRSVPITDKSGTTVTAGPLWDRVQIALQIACMVWFEHPREVVAKLPEILFIAMGLFVTAPQSERWGVYTFLVNILEVLFGLLRTSEQTEASQQACRTFRTLLEHIEAPHFKGYFTSHSTPGGLSSTHSLIISSVVTAGYGQPSAYHQISLSGIDMVATCLWRALMCIGTSGLPILQSNVLAQWQQLTFLTAFPSSTSRKEMSTLPEPLCWLGNALELLCPSAVVVFGAVTKQPTCQHIREVLLHLAQAITDSANRGGRDSPLFLGGVCRCGALLSTLTHMVSSAGLGTLPPGTHTVGLWVALGILAVGDSLSLDQNLQFFEALLRHAREEDKKMNFTERGFSLATAFSPKKLKDQTHYADALQRVRDSLHGIDPSHDTGYLLATLLHNRLSSVSTRPAALRFLRCLVDMLWPGTNTHELLPIILVLLPFTVPVEESDLRAKLHAVGTPVGVMGIEHDSDADGDDQISLVVPEDKHPADAEPPERESNRSRATTNATHRSSSHTVIVCDQMIRNRRDAQLFFLLARRLVGLHDPQNAQALGSVRERLKLSVVQMVHEAVGVFPDAMSDLAEKMCSDFVLNDSTPSPAALKAVLGTLQLATAHNQQQPQEHQGELADLAAWIEIGRFSEEQFKQQAAGASCALQAMAKLFSGEQ